MNTTSPSRILITGSSDGLGLLAARKLTEEGHRVVLHARNTRRKADALAQLPAAEAVVVADLNDPAAVLQLAVDVNALGPFDAIIHNAGVYQAGGPELLQVNVLAPWVLTSLIRPPKRLVYLSSGLHMQGKPVTGRLDAGKISYGDTKAFITLFTMALAERWPAVLSNAVDPGWVPTRMGGAGAPDSLQKGYETQAWLAVSNDPAATVSGRYFYHRQEKACLPAAHDKKLQEEFLCECERLTGVRLPVLP